VPDARSIAGIVLAGGRSSRMDGENKAFVHLAGELLITRIIYSLQSQVAILAVNSNGSLLSGEYPVIVDKVPGFAGPLAGILAGMEWAREQKLTHIATVACDTPFFPKNMVDRLNEAGDGKIALASSGERIHPVFGLWPVALADALSDYLHSDPRRSVLSFAERHGLETVEFGIGSDAVDPFFNINTRQDLAEAERLAQKFGL